MSRRKQQKVLKIRDEDDLIPNDIIYEEPELDTKIENNITDDLYLLMKKKTSEGSMINSIWTLISFSPTSAFFFVPFALSFHYMIPGIIVFILSSLVSYYTLFLLLKVIVNKQSVTNSYTQLISSLLSKKQSIVINIFMIVYYFGLSIICVYIGKELIANIAAQWFKSEIRQEGSSKWLTSLITQIIGITVFEIIFALVQKKNLTKLLHSLIMVSIALLIIAQIFYVFTNNFQLKKEIEGDAYQLGNIVSISTLGLTNHLYYNRGLRNMSIISSKRGKTLIIWSLLGEFLFYIAANLFFGLNEAMNYPQDPLLGYFKQMNNFFSQVVCLFIFILLQFKVSNIWMTLIETAELLFPKETEAQMSELKYRTRVICIISGLIFSNFIAYWLNYDDNNPAMILLVIWVVGGLCATVLSFLLPIVLYLKVFPNTTNAVKFFQILIFTICSALIGVELVSAMKSIVS